MRLIVVRHPKPLGAKGLCYGRLDLECDPHALDAAVARLTTLVPGHRIVTSPARRARDLATQLDADAAIEPRLQELDFGDWEGLLWQDLGREAIEAWQAGLPDSAPPNGETLAAMGARCAEWLGGLEPDGQPILAVTHAGPIRVLRALLNGEPLLTHFNASVPFAEPAALELQGACVNAGLTP
jgi:alpha-ribazole phosphatase